MAVDVKFYCEVCERHVAVSAETVQKDRLNDEPWADILCAECGFVIATVVSCAEGELNVNVTPHKSTEAKS